MIKLKVHICFLCLIFLLSSCYNEEIFFDSSPNVNLELPLLLNFDHKTCAFDANLKMFRFGIPEDTVLNFSPFVEFRNNTEVIFNGKVLKNKKENLFGNVEINKSYPLNINIDSKQYEFELVFTALPIVQVICDSEVRDEPKTLARIKYYDPKLDILFSSFVGIEYRGKFSRSFPKKSFGFSLWDEGLSDKKFDANILGTGKNCDWILNGAVVDPSRIRNIVSFEIWNEMGKTVSEPVHLGIDSRITELFFNNEFRGIYLFSENMNHYRLNAGNEAVLYKAVNWANGATRFECYDEEISTNQFWNGWEQKYPDRKEEIKWEPLNDLYKLVISASNEEFAEYVGEVLDVPLFIDYFLLLNLTSAPDNTGKNVFLFKNENDEKFKIIPWDLDGSWGVLYDGSRSDNQVILSNDLYNRLWEVNPNNYRQKLRDRWFFLRGDCLAREKLAGYFNKYFHLFQSSDLILKENQVWNIELNMENEQEYIHSWMDKRLQFLDEYFQTVN